ncbi:MAG: ethanolamine utilization protein [Rhodocyclaceae bacterium]|nr:ethanolamine utilization protein [Rhodocyclaceae bacterium]MCA3076589.1 ethanolamine utilization protein [Rhodocyclaceae bacterium]MCA3091078.1 ethanolamine utilization protein [Rhodocyclaceae bacterium]MCA3095200.1 ethanolamine utilization protein [Rhodocyclaceae bacterium]MCA3100025.1 ethanolamine utilization protein [Rhodocyclaceae bacterium]
MIAALFDRPAVLLDLETTGASPARDRITEIGLVEIGPGLPDPALGEDPVSWSTLVQPGMPIPPFISGLTGIDDDMVATAPRFADLAADLARRLEGKVLVAHNVRFDYGFLRAEFERAGIAFALPALCSARLSRKLYPQYPRHNLDSLIARHGLHCSERHRALGDARVIGDFLVAAVTDLGADRVREVASALTAPAGTPRETVALADELADAPGCFVLRASDGGVLYVGGGASMRGEALRLLQKSSPLGRALLSEAATVDPEPHPGVLGAALAQRRLIERFAPKHQRRVASEPLRESWSLAWSGAPASGFALREAGLSAGTRETRFGDFPDERTARKALAAFAREHRLCLPRLGLMADGTAAREAADRPAAPAGGCATPCAAAARRECLGAGQTHAPGLETEAAHLGRALTALARLPRPTPTATQGRVGFRETDIDGRSELHVFEGPHYLGSVEDADALADLDARARGLADGSLQPDPQPLRILARLLKTPGLRIERIRL